jgi:hypothetical protein
MKIIIVHGWDFKPRHNWYPWLGVELAKQGYEVSIPDMPNSSAPVINEWADTLAQNSILQKLLLMILQVILPMMMELLNYHLLSMQSSKLQNKSLVPSAQ